MAIERSYPTAGGSCREWTVTAPLPQGSRRRLTPLAWLFTCQRNLANLRRTGDTANPDRISWSLHPSTGEQALSFRQLTMIKRSDLAQWAASAINAAKQDLMPLLFLTNVHALDGPESALVLPATPKLNDICDDVCHLATGYSFTMHEANVGWVAKARQYMENAAATPNNPFGSFVTDGAISNHAISKYVKSTMTFLRHLLVAIHITYGQPARAPELLSIFSSLDNA